MVERLKKFNWWRIILPTSTYYKKAYGFHNPVMYLIDLTLLILPFGTLISVLLVKYVLNDVED